MQQMECRVVIALLRSPWATPAIRWSSLTPRTRPRVYTKRFILDARSVVSKAR